jgi:hypothetical protein
MEDLQMLRHVRLPKSGIRDKLVHSLLAGLQRPEQGEPSGL